ncbi:Phospholipase D zeta 1 [Glycine max]|nr:Phospholipase D zeta 1 [Glycine max]
MVRFISREPLVSIADLTLFIYEELAVNVHYMECFGSFAPIRGLTEDGSQAQWFVDGQETFEAIATSIQDAKSNANRLQIFITGWWLCPELYLRRPFDSFSTSRLDSLLEEKANQGVQIYVLLYKEVSLALKINSLYSMRRLLKIHENVRVLRYPDHFAAHLISQGSILGVEVNVSRKSYSTQLVVMEDENGNQNSAPPQNEGFLIPNIFTLTIPQDLSHPFLAKAIKYLDQLGIASCYNTKVYCRQTLIGGNYGLLNTTTFAPNLDYYSAVLWHRLMGKKVLAVSSDVHIKDFYL